MNTQISTKLAALAVALMMNSLIIGGVAYLFSGQIHQQPVMTALAQTFGVRAGFADSPRMPVNWSCTMTTVSGCSPTTSPCGGHRPRYSHAT